MSETEQEETQRPLTIAMVVDTSGNRGNRHFEFGIAMGGGIETARPYGQTRRHWCA